MTPLPTRMLAGLRAAALAPGDTLVVAVSGGLDSVALLALLRLTRADHGLDLHVAHLDHRLRGEAGAADARYVAELAETWRVPFTVSAADAAAWGRRYGLGEEAAAREVRYRFLAGVAEQTGAAAVATGHTKDDQIETILLHLLRGAGPGGWTGMLPDSRVVVPARGAAIEASVRVLRPLLGVRRQELFTFANAQALAWVHDATNSDPRYTRNRLRHEVLPHLGSINPRWRDALLRTAELIRDEHAVVQAAADTAWPTVAAPPDPAQPAAVRLNLPALATQPSAVQRLLLRRAVAAFAPAAEVPLERLDAALDLLERPTGTTIELGGGLAAWRAYAWVVVGEPHPTAPSPAWGGGGTVEPELLLPPLDSPSPAWGGGGGVRFSPPDHAWRLHARIVPRQEWRVEEATPWRVGVDAAVVGEPLVVRGWEPGDRLQPLGMRGIKKVQDLLVDLKVPRAARRRLRLLVSPHGVVWVIGLRLAEWAKVTETTRQVLTLEFEPGPAP